jgi:hypothetical protein
MMHLLHRIYINKESKFIYINLKGKCINDGAS